MPLLTQWAGREPCGSIFLDMGLIPGEKVTLVKFAPMGDPMELQIHGYELTLRLDEQAILTVAGEHPDCEVISALLSRHPEFSAAFTEIAAQSAALRDLRSLRTMVLYASSAHSYSVLASGPGETVYQVSLKGDMNHFYFTR